MSRSSAATVEETKTSRERLLEAASEVFAAEGYNSATTRQIGAAAGVDPALIARYFGNKEGLYVSVIEATRARGAIVDRSSSPLEFIDALLTKWLENPHTPFPGILVRQNAPSRVMKMTRGILGRIFVEPVTEVLRTLERTSGAGSSPSQDATGDDGDTVSQLESEILVAAMAGISLGHTGGTLTTLGKATEEEIRESLIGLLHPRLAERAA